MSRKKRTNHSYSYKKSRFDVFRGNVHNPGEFVFIFSLIGIMCLGTMIVFAVFSAPRSYEDLTYTNLRFARYEVHDEHLHLYTGESDTYYSVPAYRETLTDPDDFLQLCTDSNVFYVGYVDYPKADVPHFGLESIQGQGGTVYLTMEAIHEYRWGDAPAAYAILGGFTALWLATVIMSIYIGRHPERFSRRTIKLFFKDGVIRRSHGR